MEKEVKEGAAESKQVVVHLLGSMDGINDVAKSNLFVVYLLEAVDGINYRNFHQKVGIRLFNATKRCSAPSRQAVSKVGRKNRNSRYKFSCASVVSSIN